MRALCGVAGAALFAWNVAGLAEAKVVPCEQTVNAPLQARATLIIDSQPAGIQIVGSDREGIHVSCTAGNDDNAENVRLQFKPTPDGGKLSIDGSHLHHGDNGLEVKIEVPRRTNVRVRMLAGEVRVEEVKGNKDIDLGAGQITISSIHEGDYREVDASVSIGEVQARAFGTDKGGFFRSFTRKDLKGDYELHAHVTTGQIDLFGNSVRKGGSVKPD